MTYQFRKPDPATISKMFSMLLGRKVTIGSGARLKTGSRDVFTAATFRTEEGTLVGIAAMDLSLSAALGCSLSLMPPHIHKQIVNTGEFDEMAWDNLHEVYNITTRFFHDAFSGVMIALDKVYTNPGDLPREQVKYIRRASSRYDFTCDVHGYGNGAIAFASNGA